MDIVIIGSGNVAATLGRKFTAAGHKISQIVSRNASAATQLAYEWDTESANYLSLIQKNADFYLVAVSDSAIATLAADLRLPGRIVAHTAASVPKDVLKVVSDHYGVFYPLQTLRKEKDQPPPIPIYYDGADAIATKRLRFLAHSISYQEPVEASDEQRLKLHVAAVVVNNFVNHLYALAEEYCRKEGIAFSQLLPLMEETVARIHEVSPEKAQTGPAIRHDKETLEKHLKILNDHPQLKNIYLLMTDSIQHPAG